MFQLVKSDPNGGNHPIPKLWVDLAFAALCIALLAALAAVPSYEIFGLHGGMFAYLCYLLPIVVVWRTSCHIVSGGYGIYNVPLYIHGWTTVALFVFAFIMTLCISWLPAYLLWDWQPR